MPKMILGAVPRLDLIQLIIYFISIFYVPCNIFRLNSKGIISFYDFDGMSVNFNCISLNADMDSYFKICRFKNGTRRSCTFSNEQIRQIERENKILLAKILNQGPTNSKKTSSMYAQVISTEFVQFQQIDNFRIVFSRHPVRAHRGYQVRR